MISDSDESPTTDDHEYTIDDYYKLVKPLWSHKNVNFDPKIDHHKVFRSLVDLSLTRTMLLSDLQKTSIAIGDLSVRKMRNVDNIVVRIGDDSLDSDSFSKSQAKESDVRSHESSSVLASSGTLYSSCVRSRYVEFCPCSAISAYLFSRFHIPNHEGQLELQLEDPEDTTSILKVKLLRGRNSVVPMSSSQQAKTIGKVLKIAGFNRSDTNLRRLLLAHAFELPARLSAQMIEDLPFDTVVQVAGFDTEKDYSILRSACNPPQNLLDKIFPFINEAGGEKGSKPRKGSEVGGSENCTLASQETIDVKQKQVRELLKMLRESLCQDMIIIKKRYPHNPLSKCEIFNSPEFEAFVKKVEKNGDYDRLMRESCFNPQDDETESDSDDPWPSSIDFDSKEDMQRLMEFQNSKLKRMEKDIENGLQQQLQVSNHLYNFIEKQTEAMNKQSDFLRNIQNSINGLIILGSSKNKNNEYLAQQSLQDTARYINSGENEHIRAGIDNTLGLLSRLRSQDQHHREREREREREGGTTSTASPSQSALSHTKTYPSVYSPPAPTFYQPQQPQQVYVAPTTSTHRPSEASISSRSSMVSSSSPQFQPPSSQLQPQQPPPQKQHHLHNLHHHQQNVPRSSLSHTSFSHNTSPAQFPHQQQPPQEPFPSSSSSLLTQFAQPVKTPRESTLEKRLSRQASTLYEMWDDFKNLEKELAQHNISVTEWLKVHGSSERQFRHTRLKIIKFVEEEARRRNVTVGVVKEMLHNKMRNRLRPWTLDEVQRMLTSGRRIDLDDPRL
ncbi:hypothetical protein KGF57_001409 [Candida theae]|uniref:Ndc10 domain-containing protein n=1 Tax=Candida theae TaxID=1198502 RepID=A0AAD5FZX0_9ASCO|nr:uncharacterized protein KGF57_001409 [Candida theae]KAI5962757.1 hypothetical protein KGF57_001409 [Candida theae]